MNLERILNKCVVKTHTRTHTHLGCSVHTTHHYDIDGKLIVEQIELSGSKQ